MVKSEAKIQQEIVLWFRNNNLGTNNIIFSVPNHKAGNESTGQLNGVSDLIMIYNRVIYFIEVKVPLQIDNDNGKVYPRGVQSKDQIKFQKKAEDNGYIYKLIYSLEEFQRFIASIDFYC
jgi:hypothetical protein